MSLDSVRIRRPFSLKSNMVAILFFSRRLLDNMLSRIESERVGSEVILSKLSLYWMVFWPEVLSVEQDEINNMNEHIIAKRRA